MWPQHSTPQSFLAAALGQEIVITPQICSILLQYLVILINVVAELDPEIDNLSSHIGDHFVNDSLSQLQCSAQTLPNLTSTQVVHPTYKSCPSILQKLCIRPTKRCASDLQKVVHPTYKKLCIRPTTVVHPTYKKGLDQIHFRIKTRKFPYHCLTYMLIL